MVNEEFERKLMLTKKEYQEMDKKFSPRIQEILVNYYYDTVENNLEKYDETLRVRQRNNQLKLEYKFGKNYNNGIRKSNEYTAPIMELPLEIMSNILKPYYTREKSAFFLQGQLITHRKTIYLEQVQICLDCNYYLGICDFELEIEGENSQCIEKIFDSLGMSLISSKLGKYKRFVRGKEKLKNNILKENIIDNKGFL